MPAPASSHDASSFLAAHDLSGVALFRYFDALAHGVSRTEAERVALAADLELAHAETMRFVDVTPAEPGGLGRARAAVAEWFERHPGAGTHFVDGACVCVELREPLAEGLGAGLRRIARERGWGAVIGRVDGAGRASQQAFRARRRPTSITPCLGVKTGSGAPACR